MNEKKVVYSIIDIETTGGSRQGNKITEIAIINFDGEKVIDEFSSLINPEISIPFSITRLTGITNEMVANAPKFYEVAKKIVEMTKGHVFVAHNVFFDYNFIKHEFSELGFQYSAERLCTVRLSRKLLPGHASYSLGKLCKDLGIEITARHRALGDAKATVELLKLLLQRSESSLGPHIYTKSISLPSNLEQKTYDSLPEKEGVYYFHNLKGELLYIGKSTNIKKRVTGHFRPDLKRKKDIELKDRIADIQYQVTGHELTALLLEAHEIKTLRPLYNKALNRIRTPYGIELSKNSPYEIKVVSTKTHPECEYKFSSKNVAIKKRDSLYQAVLGTTPDSFFYEKVMTSYLEKLGEEEFNKLIEKVFYGNSPKETDYRIKLKGRSLKEVAIIRVRDKFPEYLEFWKGTMLDTKIKLIHHDELRGLLERFMAKNKIKTLPYFDE